MMPESRMAVAKAPLHPYTMLIPKSLEDRFVPDTYVHEPKTFRIREEQKATKVVKGSMNFLEKETLVSRMKNATIASPKKI